MIPIRFISNDQKKLNFFKHLLFQKFEYREDDDSKIVCNFDFLKSETKICYYNTQYSFQTLPTSLQEIFIYFDQTNKLINFKFSNLSFFPFKSEIMKEDKKINLTNIHRTILLYLLSSNDGISKIDLYQKIWPNDKECILNKLDTHLTNLKNLINQNFNIQPNIITSNRKIIIS